MFTKVINPEGSRICIFNQWGKAIYNKWADGDIEEYAEYDERGNMIRYRQLFNKICKTEMWFTYDRNDRCICYVNSHGLYEISKYDERGNEISHKVPGGEITFKYDDHGNMIERDSKVARTHTFYKYDDNNNCIYEEGYDKCDMTNYKVWREYDENNGLVYHKTIENKNVYRDEKDVDVNQPDYTVESKVFESWYKYNSNGNVIYKNHGEGVESWFEYDEHGNLIHTKSCGPDSCFEEWSEFDSDNREVHFKNSHNDETWREYDSKGNMIHVKQTTEVHEEEYWQEFDEFGNVTFYKDSYDNEIKYKYDTNGNLIYCKHYAGYTVYKDYDSNGVIVCQRTVYDKDNTENN